MSNDSFEEIKANLNEKGVTLIAVSKTKPISAIRDIYESGHRIFGENKVQELVEKQPQLPNDIEWHMIGHLQRNKVKYIAPFISMIHSIDNLKLLKEVNKQAIKNNREIDCLLQFRIAKEDSKFGIAPEEIDEFLNDDGFRACQNIRIRGVMGMATFTDNHQIVRSEFKLLKSVFDHLKTEYFPSQNHFSEISMGMSGDYEIAIEEGSTMVRLGTLIFGARNYSN